MDFGIATVVAITALVYIICLCVKASHWPAPGEKAAE